MAGGTKGSTPAGIGDLLRDRRIRRLAGAEFVSALGSGIVAITITFVTYRTTGSLVRTVLVTAAYTFPAAVLSGWAGHLADRHDRRRLLVGLSCAKAATYVAIAAMSFAGVLDANWLLVASFVAGSLSALVFPAWEEYEKDLIPGDQLAAVNALFSSMSSVAGLIGAVAGGLIVATIGATTSFVVDALSFVPLIVVIASTRPEQTKTRGRAYGRGDLRRTFAVVRSNPPLRRAIRNVALLAVLAIPVVQLLPAIAREIEPGATTLGFVTASYTLGGVTVAWVITRVQRLFDRATIVESSFFLCSIAFVLFGLGGAALNGAELYVLIAISLLPVGLALSLAQSVISAILQIHAPDESQGQVFAIYGIVFSVLAPLGGLVFSGLTEAMNVFATVGCMGGVLLLVSCYVVVTVHRGRMRGELPAGPGGHLVLAHHGSSGPAGGLWMHHSLRTPLVVIER